MWIRYGDIVNSMHLPRALRAICSKNADQDQFLALLDAAMRGESALEALTRREYAVLELLARSIPSNQELAACLMVRRNTARCHPRHILIKLELRNRTQVVAYALRQGLIDRPSSS
jgi:DNA-binding CsgD family transcriptional regulator